MQRIIFHLFFLISGEYWCVLMPHFNWTGKGLELESLSMTFTADGKGKDYL